MTIGAWLAARTPAPPEALRSRVAALIAPNAERDARDTAAVCLAVARDLLTALVSHDATGSRDEAFDLLAVDALVTYALEAAAEEDIDGLPSVATPALRMFAETAA